MKLATCILLILSLTASLVIAEGYGYKIVVTTDKEGMLFFGDELNFEEIKSSAIVFQEPGMEKTFFSDKEYVLVFCGTKESTTTRVEIYYLDEKNQPLQGLPVKVLVDGNLVGVRLHHPYWHEKES